MSIEKSVFDQDKMKTFLLKKYGLHLNESRHLPLGTANCYKITCDEGTYFFKEYQKESEEIEKEEPGSYEEFLETIDDYLDDGKNGKLFV